jgi:hypothetical protein
MMPRAAIAPQVKAAAELTSTELLPLAVGASLFLGSTLIDLNCPGDEPPRYDTFGIEAKHADGSPVSGEAAYYCVRRPVLTGSRIEHELDVEGPITVTVVTMSDELSLRFEGIIEGEVRDFDPTTLRADGPRTVEVTGVDGTEVRVLVLTGCSVPEPSP